MKKLGYILILAFLPYANTYGQESARRLEGRVFSTSNDVTAVHVSNVATNRGTITDFDGYFEIAVHLGDTLVFSAVQFKRKEVIITQDILKSPLFLVALEDSLTELNEVVVMPYNLSGELKRDLTKYSLDDIITASTEGLPNAYIKLPTQSQRQLFAATDWDCNCTGAKLDPLFNYFSGRTKMLNKRLAREAQSKWIEAVRGYYPDSVYVQELKIPKNNVGDFIYSIENDSLFEATVREGDRLLLWEVLKRKSVKYLKDNEVDKN